MEIKYLTKQQVYFLNTHQIKFVFTSGAKRYKGWKSIK
jgi:hypothetical protein